MINNSEYEKMCKLIKKGELKKLQDFINLSYEKGNKKYLLEAKNALVDYLDYYPQSFIKYLDRRIIISDNVSGGFILYNDEIIDGSFVQRDILRSTFTCSLTSTVDNIKLQHIRILLEKFDQIDKTKLRLVSDVETTKKQASVYGRGYANPHNFEKTRYNSFKMLGEDVKIYVSSPKATPLLYGESSKGKGFVLGLRK